MITRGEYKDGDIKYDAIVSYSKPETEVILATDGTIVSAYRTNKTGEYSFINKKAKDVYKLLQTGIKGCKAKNGVPNPFIFGTSVRHEFIKSKVEYNMELYNNELCGAEIITDEKYVYLEYDEKQTNIPKDIPYIKLTVSQVDIEAPENDADSVLVRSIEEIALEKEDVTWLNGKKYYIVNDDEQAEAIFDFLDNYNGPIAYDTETTGLKINCFSKINSSYQRDLIKWNEENPEDQLRADRLVGIIFCVEDNVSYYFPCFNRKFKNLYEGKSGVRDKTVEKIKMKYTVGELWDKKGDMAEFIRNTHTEEWSSDIVLMERVRNILETKHIVAHNGSFEWKTGWIYEIDTNLKDDTMILHQIMYKFRSTTSNRGEPSNLKYLAKVELGIEQWDLGDFFPDFKEDKAGTVRGSKGKKANSRIDFSYMDYDGTRIYAPTDGDVTLQLFKKYKSDLVNNHKEQEYIYNVEVMVASAIAYMEFYGHRIDEEKIYAVRDQTKAEIILIESEIRQMIKYSSTKEIELYNQLKEMVALAKRTDSTSEEGKKLNNGINELTSKLTLEIKENVDNVLNLSSPAQVAELFFNKLEIPFSGEKMSVAKKAIKPLLKAKDDEGNNKYPIVHLYSEYKNKDTLMTKFFDNLPNFMYPGGIIFSSYGQISTATGRMSCSRPNAQQYPKAVTNIVSARKGNVLLASDYSQIEYRVLVALSGEEFLADLFKDPDNDYHTLMASLMYGVPYASVTPKMRGDAKSFNFGIPYGMGLGSLAILLTGVNNQSTREEAAEKYELYFKDQPKTRKFFDQVKEMAQVNKYTKTFWNRYRYYSFVDKDGKESSARKAMALRQAGNAIIQGTAADIFKIAVARNWAYIRENGLIGDLLIINMVHDEILFEVNTQSLNVDRVLADIGENMQFKVNGFPPLFVGAGIGHTWSVSKGKMAEIHPYLMDKIIEETREKPIRRDEEQVKIWREPDVTVDFFNKRVYQFREGQVMEYITNPDNFHKDIHPAIGNLLNLQFSFGHDKESEKLSDTEYTQLCLQEFINHHNIDGITADLFKVTEQDKDVVEDAEYDDGYDEDDVELEDGQLDTNFALVDESDVVFGTDIHQIIATFGSVVAPHLRICGLDTRNLTYKTKDAITDFLMEHLCEKDDPGAMQIVFLNESNVLNNTGLWVKGINGSEVEKRLKMAV